MNVIVMAGGRGSRISNRKKMLLKIKNKTLIERSLDIIHNLKMNVYICISNNTDFLLKVLHDYSIINGSGDYITDLKASLDTFGLPAIIMPADIVYSGNIIEEFIISASKIHDGIINLKINGQLSGISIFYEKPLNKIIKFKDISIFSESFFNINYPEDYNNAVNYFTLKP